jgi:formate dehydrogenase iron-sulfur subunit
MDKCTFCAGGPEADFSKEEYEKYGANRMAPVALQAPAIDPR